MPKVLLTSVCRPLGEKYGDAPSVGYELLYGQVTREQGLFSPRANHVQFSLAYIAENLEAPTTVLHYPSRRELIAELKSGYDYVGLSFVLSTFHRMKEAIALVRKHAPNAKIVLGGYGTVLSDEELAPWCDYVCREEGAAFMQRLLGETCGPQRHPMVVSRLRVFSREVSRTGMVFAGLGCPNGCDFCCTSHFFKRKHIRLLETGREIYDVIQRYQELEPGDGNRRARTKIPFSTGSARSSWPMRRRGGKPPELLFASVKAQQYRRGLSKRVTGLIGTGTVRKQAETP